MKENSCCFSGHRELPAGKTDEITRRLEAEVRRLIDQGVTVFYAGGALGFDTLAARLILSLKKENPQIMLFLALPCMDQAKRWSAADIRVYEQIKSEADAVVYVSQEYTRYCMQLRDRYMVDRASHLLCYQTKETGGTAYTVRYARKKGLEIVNIALPD